MIVNASHISQIRDDIQKQCQSNAMYPKLYEEYQNYFNFKVEADFEPINSVIVIAVPQPQYEVKFHWNGRVVPLIIPPTYLYGVQVTSELTELLKSILEPAGFHAAYARLPVKTLAVRTALAQYGRNNITYVPGMGSFHRLSAFYSDLQIEKDEWYDLNSMELCKECSACRKNCPTGAIPSDRFLLRVEKCLTYHNEQPKEISFPDWIDPSWHNCFIGCMRCQHVCPMNNKVKDWVEPLVEFSESETRELLDVPDIESLSKSLKEKLESTELIEYFELIPRNLSSFF